MATVTVHFPRCNSDKVYRHGHSCSRHERFRCRSCKRVFQLAYSCEVRKPGVKEQSVEMAHNGAGGRDTTRTSRWCCPYLMSSGASLAARRNNTGSGMRTTLKLAVCWLTLSGHGMYRHGDQRWSEQLRQRSAEGETPDRQNLHATYWGSKPQPPKFPEWTNFALDNLYVRQPLTGQQRSEK